MKEQTLAIGAAIAWSLLLAACVIERVPREIIEPLPDGLTIAAEQDIEPGRIGGWELCMLIIADGKADARTTMSAVEDHLITEKEWSRDEVARNDGTRWLLRPEGGGGRLWIAEEYMRESPRGPCADLLRQSDPKSQQSAIVLHVYW